MQVVHVLITKIQNLGLNRSEKSKLYQDEQFQIEMHSHINDIMKHHQIIIK